MPDRYAAFGYPMGHAKSPRIHNLFAQQTGECVTYEAIEVPTGTFKAALDVFRAEGGLGANVTVPYKIDACAYASDLTARARSAGSVNCLRFSGREALGANFDGVGLVTDLQANLAVAIRGLRVLLLGAGGAARGIVLPLLEQNPACLTVANRTAVRAAALATAFAPHGTVSGVGYDELVGHSFDLVINATTASINWQCPAIPPGVFAPGCLAYDLAYCRGATPFLQLAYDAKCDRLVDGIGMLVEQAAEAFAWWRGVRPQTRPVIEALAVPITPAGARAPGSMRKGKVMS